MEIKEKIGIQTSHLGELLTLFITSKDFKETQFRVSKFSTIHSFIAFC